MEFRKGSIPAVSRLCRLGEYRVMCGEHPVSGILVTMSAEKPYVTTVELIFRESDGQLINPLLVFEASVPIPQAGEEITFYGNRFKILSRQFSYEKRITDIRVLFICEKISRPDAAPQFIPHIPHE
jgi:hypothetical protein